MKRPRLLLADDHPLFLTGLRTLLETECEVVGAVQDVIRNRIHVSPGFGEEIVEQFERRPHSFTGSPSVLTARQREILQLVAEGRTAKEMASILNVSLQTVAFHKHQIMNKLGLRTTAELTKYAIQEGLVAT